MAHTPISETATSQIAKPDTGASQASTYRLGLILVTCSAIAWSLAGLFTRSLPLDPATLLVWRCLWGAIGMIVLAFALEGRGVVGQFRSFVRPHAWPDWLFAGCAVIGMICYIVALRTTSVAHVSVIYSAVPFVAAGLAWAFAGERPAPSAVAASLAAIVGIVIMVGFGTDGALLGDLLAAGMTMTMATGIVLARRYRDIAFLPAAIVSSLVATLVCLPFSAPFEVTTHQMMMLALFGLVNSSVGFGLFSLGARYVPAIETALIGALDAPLSPFWVWLVFADVPDASTLVGGLIVFVAVGLHLGLSARRTAIAGVAR